MSLIIKKKSPSQIKRDLIRKMILEKKYGVVSVRIYSFKKYFNLHITFQY